MTFTHVLCRDEGDLKVVVDGFFEADDPGDAGDWPGQRGSPASPACFVVESVTYQGFEIDCTDEELDRLELVAMGYQGDL